MKKLLAMLVVALGLSSLFADTYYYHYDGTRQWALELDKKIGEVDVNGETVRNYVIVGCYPAPEGEFTIPAKLGDMKIYGVEGYAFCNVATNITKLTVEEGVRKLGGDAFGCDNPADSKLTAIKLPAGMDHIAHTAFRNSKIEQDNIEKGFVVDGYLIRYKGTDASYAVPAGVKVICRYAFNSPAFTKLTLPDGLELIQKYGCSGLNVEEIILPDSVTSLNEYAFDECTIKSLKLGKGIVDLEKIGKDDYDDYVGFWDAFSDATFESIDFGDGVEAIPYAFSRGDDILGSVKFGAALRVIGADAFCGSSVSNADFSAAKALELIGFEGFDSSKIQKADLSACTALKKLDTYAFWHCHDLAEVKLPASLEIISNSVFSETAITVIEIPAGVKEINACAFESCSNLTEVKFNEGLEYLGNEAFYGCTKLAKVEFPKSLLEIGDYAFYGCSALAEVKLNEGLEYLGYEAFAECCELTEVDIPETVTYIDGYLFDDCTKLTKVTGGEGVEACDANSQLLGDCPFSYCGETDPDDKPYPSFEIVRFGKFILGCRGTCPANYTLDATVIGDAEVIGCSAFDHDNNDSLTNLVKVVVPETVKVIGQRAFYEDAGLKTLDLAAASAELKIGYEAFYETGIEELKGAVSWIGYSSFSGCENLKEIDIAVEPIVEVDETDPEWTYYSYGCIDPMAFGGCTGLTNATVVVGACVEDEWNDDSWGCVGDEVFYGCENLKRVNVAARGLGDDLFADCSAVENATVNAQRIPSGFLYGNTNLTELALGDMVEEIGDSAFFGCWSLKAVDLPETVAYLGPQAFNSCSNLTEVTGGAGLVRVDTYAFIGTKFWDSAAKGATQLGTVLVKWTDDKDGETVEIPAGVENIASSAFLGSTAKKVVVPATVAIVREFVFDGCPNLETVEFKNNAIRLANYWYDDCPLLEQASGWVVAAPGGHLFRGWNEEWIDETYGYGFSCYYPDFEKLRFHNDTAADGIFEPGTAYTGWIMDGNTVVGSVTVKTGKLDKNGQVKVTASVQLSGLKKNYTAMFTIDENGKAVIDDEDANWYNELCGMVLGGNWLSGDVTLGGRTYTVRGGNAKNAVEAFDAYAGHVWAIALKSNASKAYATYTGYSTLTVAPAKKGKVKVTGMMADGTKVSATAQMVAGDNGVIAAPVTVGLYAGKRGGFSFLLGFYMDGDQPKMYFDTADPDGAIGAWSAPYIHEHYRVWSTTSLMPKAYGEVDLKGTGVSAEKTYVSIGIDNDTEMLARACKGFDPLFGGGTLTLDKKGKWTFAKAAKLSLAKPKDLTNYAEEIAQAVADGDTYVLTHDGKELEAYYGEYDELTDRYTSLAWWIWDIGTKVAKDGKITWGKNTNMCGLKLKYTQKTGAFSGSSQYYWVERTNPEKHSLKKGKFTIGGVAIDGKLYGSAVAKGIASFFVESDEIY